MIDIVFGDILRQDVDVIVNPANSWMLHGGGLAAQIARRGGPKLVMESRENTPPTGVPTGEAIITSAGNLPYKAVIHAVGPIWEPPDDNPYWNSSNENPGLDPDELLAKAYRSSIRLAKSQGYESIAFPAISCGVFRFPVARAAPIAIKAIRDCEESGHGLERVVICLLDDDHYAAFTDALAHEPAHP